MNSISGNGRPAEDPRWLLQSALLPDWPAPPGVRALCTTRAMGDMKSAAARAALQSLLPAGAAPAWLKQVHGTRVVDAASLQPGELPEADASFADRPGKVCVVMAADCMPVLFAARDGHAVAAAHAGWRGLCSGVIERTVEAMGLPGTSLLAWMGPAIGPNAYEVGSEVRDAFLAVDARAESAFAPSPQRSGHWMLDMPAVARQRLAACGISAVYGGDRCTHAEPRQFWSWRRDAASQRMAALIWRS